MSSASVSSQSKGTPTPTPAPAPAAAPAIEKPIVLMKSREEGKGPAGATETSAQPPAAVAKVEKEGQRPTQPVYQIQNRGMGSTAPSSVMDRKSREMATSGGVALLGCSRKKQCKDLGCCKGQL